MAVRLAKHNAIMRAKRLVQHLCGVNDDRLSWRIEPRCHELYKLFVLGFLQGSAPQGLELVVVQGAFLDVLLGDVVKVGVALDRLHEPNAARNAPHVVGDVARVVSRLWLGVTCWLNVAHLLCPCNNFIANQYRPVLNDISELFLFPEIVLCQLGNIGNIRLEGFTSL